MITADLISKELRKYVKRWKNVMKNCPDGNKIAGDSVSLSSSVDGDRISNGINLSKAPLVSCNHVIKNLSEWLSSKKSSV